MRLADQIIEAAHDVMGDRGPTPDKPTPQRLGALVDCFDPTLQSGFVTWVDCRRGVDGGM
jgi:hypothetical protein